MAEARREGFAVVVHQPAEIRAWARLTRTRAKTDRIDAALIAAATARLESLGAVQAGGGAPGELAERLAAYEQVADEVARLETFRDRLTLPDLKAGHAARIRALEQVKRAMLQALVAVVKACPEPGPRWRLLLSLPGVGPLVAASLVVRMPELGGMRRGQAASLLGVAPFARDSGTWSGRRFVQGGRARPRRLLDLAAVNARRADAGPGAFSEGLVARGKPPKVALVALMRNLIEAADLVLARNAPWVPAQAK